MHSAPEKFREEVYNKKKKKRYGQKSTLNIFYTYGKKAIGTGLCPSTENLMAIYSWGLRMSGNVA